MTLNVLGWSLAGVFTRAVLNVRTWRDPQQVEASYQIASGHSICKHRLARRLQCSGIRRLGRAIAILPSLLDP